MSIQEHIAQWIFVAGGLGIVAGLWALVILLVVTIRKGGPK